jgi:hypothetical protein
MCTNAENAEGLRSARRKKVRVRENLAISNRAAIAMVPENWNYYHDLAELNPKIAVTNLKRAIELNPRNVSLRIELGDDAD